MTRGEKQRRRATIRHSEIAAGIGVARGVFQLEPQRGAGVQVRVVLDQQARDISVLLGDRPHQSRLSAFVLGGVDVRAMLEKPLDRGKAARPGGGHQRGLAHLERSVRVSTGSEQPLDHRRAAVDRGQPQGSGAELVGRVDVRAGLDEQGGCVEIVPVRSPMERRGTIALGHIDVSPPGDQRARRLEVTRLHSFDDRRCKLRARGNWPGEKRTRPGENGCHRGKER